jgi:hypothetical protein
MAGLLGHVSERAALHRSSDTNEPRRVVQGVLRLAVAIAWLAGLPGVKWLRGPIAFAGGGFGGRLVYDLNMGGRECF